eukprot:CAMPEP_0175097712 /NCGR_PEP_ID=MMETSP0086_2-20121207/5433_1 /TAXON_ID=136419 /ORGANISM="Unknown Unknown, Strain D1" /LENGTH=494 /DNA_ID=CAMNT_0016371241 /DNA_START=31 /DNA_END=1516 /DNA_ORIENTATION=-
MMSLDIPEYKSNSPPAWLRSPRNFSPSQRSFSPTSLSGNRSPKQCAINGCNNARFQRGYCAEHANQGLSATQTIGTNNRTPQGRHANQKEKGFSQTAPLETRRKHDYPIRKDDETFQSVQSAWTVSWEKFVSRLNNPYAPATGYVQSYSRSLLEAIMRMCEFIPAITNTHEWDSREQMMVGQLASDVVKMWGGAVVTHANKDTEIADNDAIRLLIDVMQGLAPIPPLKSGEKRLGCDSPETIRFNRNWCAQLLSAVSMNLPTCVSLYSGGVLDGCVKQMKEYMMFEEEDMTVQSLLHFLIQSSYVWKLVPDTQYPARDWGRQAGQCVAAVLDPAITDKGQASVNSKGRALMTVLVAYLQPTVPEFPVEHTRAMLEVPHLMSHIVHWFYERHSMVESFEDVVTEVIRAFLSNARQLPSFLQNILKKALHFGKKCAECGNAAPNVPMTTRCTCKELLYCSRQCQTNHWEAGHKSQCKASWQEEILAPVGVGGEEDF